MEWEISERTNSVQFLDLTLTIKNNRIHSTLYKKPLNLHLYLPARSAHPPGVLHGLIAGHIYRAFSLCSSETDATASVNNIYQYLRRRGYSHNTLQPIFDKALANKKVYNPIRPPLPQNGEGPWFFKIPYHPQNPPSHLIQRAWKECIANPPFGKALEFVDIKFRRIGHHRFVICYNRAKNLGNILTYRKIHPDSGPPVSSFI